MLRTDLLPYDDVADLFIIDPDGFIIRKWNSKQLNNGLMTAEFQVSQVVFKLKLRDLTCSVFQVPDYPKVGFWTIRVSAQGQIQEKQVTLWNIL